MSISAFFQGEALPDQQDQSRKLGCESGAGVYTPAYDKKDTYRKSISLILKQFLSEVKRTAGNCLNLNSGVYGICGNCTALAS